MLREPEGGASSSPVVHSIEFQREAEEVPLCKAVNGRVKGRNPS